MTTVDGVYKSVFANTTGQHSDLTMKILLVAILASLAILQGAKSDTIDCTGSHRYHATGTAYYPDPSSQEGGYVDMRDTPLQTLQAYLEGTASVVTVAMDNHAGIRYDTPVCIPELNRKYNRFIDFRVRDTGGDFTNKGHSRIDICVRTRHDSYDDTINGPLTLVFN